MKSDSPTTFIDPALVLRHLDDPEWIILDCRYDLATPDAGRQAYHKSHIPGAVYLDLLDDLSSPLTGKNGRHPLPSPAALGVVFSRCGIDATRNVVVCDDASGMFAARAWWILRWLGHTSVAVLDGGLPAWTEAGGPWRGGREARPARTFVATPQDGMWIPADELGRIDRLLDARAPERYRGEVEPIDPVAGHIPGAWSYPWGTSLDSAGRVLPVPEVRARLERALGGVALERAAVYCGSGVSASHVILAMAHAGLPGARLYPGSWSEWCADRRRPVAHGHEGPPV
jgi:thiosulfate/3-mercaptopyruvate sulfurtransferase